jgi:HD-GYP domain-containing protein (c-di-GMP phosphodiesterase class II)
MAIKVKRSENEVSKIKIAGLMHDIGKIGISDSILDKSDKLSDQEWHEIQRHCEAGYRILSSADEFSEIAETILCHHERYDGKGYPKGLSGEAIPLSSRIITLADAFDAMMSDRAYRKALTQDKAIQELRLNAGHQFDPNLVEPFIQVILDLVTDSPSLDPSPEFSFNDA